MTYNKNIKMLEIINAKINKKLIGDEILYKPITKKKIGPDPGNGDGERKQRKTTAEIVAELLKPIQTTLDVVLATLKEHGAAIADINTRLDQNNLKPLVRNSK